MTRIFLGAAAGLLSSLVSLLITYVVVVLVIAVEVRDILAVVIAATTALPLLLLFIVLVPSLVIGFLTGVTIGIAGRYGLYVYLIGALAGIMFSVLVLSAVLPLILVVENFTAYATQPFFTGLYGLLLGALATRFFRWFYRERGEF